MVRNKETSEDITQEVFIKLFRLKSTKEYPSSYLYSIAHNKCIDYLRKQKRRHIFVQNYQSKTHEASIEDLVSESEYSSELESALNDLTSYERSVLILKSVSGFSYKEIAEMLNKKEDALRKQFHRAKTKIERKLKNEGVRNINEKVSII